MWLALTLAACGTDPTSNAGTDASPGFTLVYQGSVDGEIEPCG
jgi:hypothetical protein